MRRVILILVVFICSLATALAQTIIVTGRVTDKETNEGIPFANLKFKGALHGLSTDFDGYFTLELKKTSDSLVAGCIGYQSMPLRVRKTLQAQVLNFELERAVYNKKQQILIGRSESRALDIANRVVLLKHAHNRKKLNSNRFEAYTKIQVELEELSDRFQSRKLFRPF